MRIFQEVMMRRLFAYIIIAASLSFCGASMVEDERHGTKKDSSYYQRMFEAPDRAQWQMPDEVVKALELKSGQRIADIGAGSGYFTRRFARAVAPGGTAIGYDVDISMVAFMREDAIRNRLDNYQASLIGPDRPELGRGPFDLVFICNTYHHINNRVQYLKLLKPALKNGGRVVIIDYRKDSPFGPPAKYKLEESRVLEEFEGAGYTFLRRHDFLPNQYFIEFIP